MTLEENIRAAVREELRPLLAELRQLLGQRPAEDRYLPVREAAALAGVHADTLRDWLKAGHLPTHHAGRELRVRLSELEAFMRSGGKRSKVGRPSVEDEAAQTLARAARK